MPEAGCNEKAPGVQVGLRSAGLHCGTLLATQGTLSISAFPPTTPIFLSSLALGCGHSLTVRDTFNSWLSHWHRISDIVLWRLSPLVGARNLPGMWSAGLRLPVSQGNQVAKEALPGWSQVTSQRGGDTGAQSKTSEIVVCPLLVCKT